MAIEGVDYSFTRPSVVCLWGSGKRFIARYFGPGSSGKHGTRSECAAAISLGLDIVSLAEGAANDANLGYSKGVEQANSANRAAIAAGMPGDRPIMFAVDFDATTAQLANVARYADGCAAVIGRDRVGIYGGYRTVAYLAARGLAAYYFQTYAWSGGQWHGSSGLQQYRNGVSMCGGTVDLCRAVVDDYGQWDPPIGRVGHSVPSSPAPSAETPWEFGDHLDRLSRQVEDVASSVNSAALAIESLS